MDTDTDQKQIILERSELIAKFCDDQFASNPMATVSALLALTVSNAFVHGYSLESIVSAVIQNYRTMAGTSLEAIKLDMPSEEAIKAGE